MSLEKKMENMRKLAYDRMVENAKVNDEDALEHKERLVAQSNQLVMAAQRLTRNEKRIIYMVITQINSMRINNPTIFRVRAIDFINTFDITPKSAYRMMQEGADRLLTKSWKVEYGDLEGMKSTWISDYSYHKGEGWVEVTISPKTMHHLEGLGRDKAFTQYRLKEVVDFKSKYTWRLYEILSKFKKSNNKFEGWMRIKVDELRASLEVPDTYNYTMFKKQILEPAIKEIMINRNVKIEVEQIKLSRKVDKLNFIFVENEQQNLDLQ